MNKEKTTYFPSLNNIKDPDGQILSCYNKHNISYQQNRAQPPNQDLLELINELSNDSSIDAVIVTPHWGLEYKENNTYSDQQLAYSFIDNGALAVLGHHPHVVQPWEKYKQGLIVYSLGNFIANQFISSDLYGYKSAKRRSAIVLYLGLSKSRSGETFINGVRYHPFVTKYTSKNIDQQDRDKISRFRTNIPFSDLSLYKHRKTYNLIENAQKYIFINVK